MTNDEREYLKNGMRYWMMADVLEGNYKFYGVIRCSWMRLMRRVKVTAGEIII
jgi:hypothetical protein